MQFLLLSPPGYRAATASASTIYSQLTLLGFNIRLLKLLCQLLHILHHLLLLLQTGEKPNCSTYKCQDNYY